MFHSVGNIKILDDILLYRQNRNGCDVDVLLNNQRFPLLSQILAANSEFFRINLFSTPLVPTEIELKDINLEIAQQVFDYCYTSKMIFENFPDIFFRAKFLMMEYLLKDLNHSLQTNLTIQNFFEIWTLVQEHELKDFRQICLDFFKEHFNEMLQLDDILKLDSKQLCVFLKLDSYKLFSKTAFGVVVNWIEKDYETRSKDVVALLENIDLSKLSLTTLNAKYESLCNSDSSCTSKFLKIIEDKLAKQEPSPVTIITMGGWNYCNVIEFYNTTSDFWMKEGLQINRKAYCSVTLKENVLIMGGSKDKKAVDTVESYDLTDWTKRPLAPMNKKRVYFSAVAIEKYAFAIGGLDNDNKAMSSTERYNSKTDQWIELNEMPTARWGHGAAVVEGEQIYVVGGSNGTQLNSNELYSVSTGIWKKCKPMLEKRQDPGVAVLAGLVYAIGGNNGSTLTSSAERYDPKLDNWTLIENIDEPRHGIAAVSFGENIVISGGHTGDKNVDTVERYDPQTNTWARMTSLKKSRIYHQMLAVSQDLLDERFTMKIERSPILPFQTSSTADQRPVELPEVEGDHHLFFLD